jgi:hypothetical protein
VIAIKYAVFAVIATALNLLAQALSLSLYAGRNSLYVAMAVGTATGLISKYTLDKRYIFDYRPVSRLDDAQRFVYYTATGVITTAIFWGTEIAFDALWHNEFAKYLGAAIGLGVGYLLKYWLDKRFVFAGDIQ